MKILGVALSPFVRKVLVVLEIKGISCEQEPVLPGGGDYPDFKSLSPLGKIPVLLDGDYTLSDSTVICEYLEEKFPEPSTMPADLQQRGRGRFLEEYGDSKFIEAAAPVFVERFAKPNIFGEPCDEERALNAEQELLPPHLDYLEGQVPAEGFLFDRFTVADIGIVSPILNAFLGGYSIDAERWPGYAAYVQRVCEHPPVAAVREREQQFLAGMRGG